MIVVEEGTICEIQATPLRACTGLEAIASELFELGFPDNVCASGNVLALVCQFECCELVYLKSQEITERLLKTGAYEICETEDSRFCTLKRVRYSENTYLDLISRLIREGGRWENPSRCSTATLSLVSEKLSYDLFCIFPAFSCRRLFWKGVTCELLWFLCGSTDTTELSQHGVRFWDANSTAEAIEASGQSYPEGILGPTYGFQWRHCGAPYSDRMASSCSEGGVDQISKLIEGIKKDPYGRRHILCNWSASEVGDCVLPPCHVMAQFVVREKALYCVLTQRSADVVLGVMFNVASYALLTYMVAQECGLVPFRLVHHMVDCHIYEDHIEDAKKMLERSFVSRPPTVEIPENAIDQPIAAYNQFKLVGYRCNPEKYNFPMTV